MALLGIDRDSGSHWHYVGILVLKESWDPDEQSAIFFFIKIKIFLVKKFMLTTSIKFRDLTWLFLFHGFPTFFQHLANPLDSFVVRVSGYLLSQKLDQIYNKIAKSQRAEVCSQFFQNIFLTLTSFRCLDDFYDPMNMRNISNDSPCSRLSFKMS